MGARAYTAAEITWMRESLERFPRNTTLQAACQEMSRHLSRPLTATTLIRLFVTKGLATPSDYIGKAAGRVELPPPPVPDELPTEPEFAEREPVSATPPPAPSVTLPVDPVARHEAESREAKLRREHRDVLERLRASEERQRILDRLTSTPTVSPRIDRREKTSGLREATAVALASDWHVEENVQSVAVADRNEFNLEIADARVKQYFRGTRALLDFSREGWMVRDLVLWLGGDLLTGYIHEELEEDNDLSPIEAIIWLRQRLVDGIGTLLADTELERIVVPCSYGNHGRVTKRRRIKTGAKNSYEWLLYQWLASHYADEPRITFDAGQSAHQYVEVYDRTAHFHHGDEVNYWGGSGGLSIPLNKRVPKWDNVRESDYHFIGHFHQFLDLGHTLVNGSLIGYTEFAFAIGAEFEPPRQAFCLIDSQLGKCMTAPIWVEAAA